MKPTQLKLQKLAEDLEKKFFNQGSNDNSNQIVSLTDACQELDQLTQQLQAQLSAFNIALQNTKELATTQPMVPILAATMETLDRNLYLILNDLKDATSQLESANKKTNN